LILLINHPKYNLTAVFVHELNGGSQQENEAAELAYSISQGIQGSYGATPEYIRIETQLGPGGRDRGSTILLNAVSVSSGEILRIYLEKTTHGTAEGVWFRCLHIPCILEDYFHDRLGAD
jgi:hypothetical protein